MLADHGSLQWFAAAFPAIVYDSVSRQIATLKARVAASDADSWVPQPEWRRIMRFRGIFAPNLGSDPAIIPADAFGLPKLLRQAHTIDRPIHARR
jgi:hypothetical protein